MAPNPYQYLKSGLLLCRKNFATFVDTFNFLVDFARNLRGDGENNADGAIYIDRTRADHPVICSKINLARLEGTPDKGRFCLLGVDEPEEPEEGEEEEPGTVGFGNRYYRVGGKTYEMSAATADVERGYIVALKINVAGDQPSAEYETYADLAALKADEADEYYYIIPLYKLDNDFKVEVDFRVGPDAAAGEFSS